MKEIVPHSTKYSTGILIRICDKCWNEKLLGEVYMRPLSCINQGSYPDECILNGDSEKRLSVAKYDYQTL